MKTIYIIIGFALVLACIGAVSAACNCCEDEDEYPVPEGRYLTIDSYGNMMLSFFPPDAKAPFGRFADGSPIPDGYLNPAPSHMSGHMTPVEQREAFSQITKRPHTGGRAFRR